MKYKLFFSLISTILLFSVQPALAHFHYEAEVTTTLHLNEKNQLSMLDISWVYDPEASELMLKDNQNLKLLGDEVMKDLAKLGYFTKLKLNDKPLLIEADKKYQLEKIGEGNETRLKLNLKLLLKNPTTLKGKNSLAIDHTDPSGSAILYYDSDKSLKFDKVLEPNCLAMIEEKKEFDHGESPQLVTVYCDMP